MFGEPACCEHAQPTLLRRGHRFCGDSEAIAAARLDLAEHDRAAAAQHEIDLALAHAPVAIHDFETARHVPRSRGVLAHRADSTAHVAGHQSSLPASSSMLMSLNDTTRTVDANRAGRYMSHTHASFSVTSKYTRPSSFFDSMFTLFAR